MDCFVYTLNAHPTMSHKWLFPVLNAHPDPDIKILCLFMLDTCIYSIHIWCSVISSYSLATKPAESARARAYKRPLPQYRKGFHVPPFPFSDRPGFPLGDESASAVRGRGGRISNISTNARSLFNDFRTMAKVCVCTHQHCTAADDNKTACVGQMCVCIRRPFFLSLCHRGVPTEIGTLPAKRTVRHHPNKKSQPCISSIF